MSETKHIIELIGGCKSVDRKTSEETIHRKVIFGKRLTVGELIALESSPQAKNPTYYSDLILRKMIVEFGTLTMPVPLNLLLSLDSIDRDDLQEASDKFLESSRGERSFQFLEDNKVKLAFGFNIDGTEYNTVQFGNRINGQDQVEADPLGRGIAGTCFLIGRQISKISTDDGLASIEGQLELKHFESLDAEGLTVLKVGAEIFRQSFRLEREKISRERNGDESVPPVAGNEDERSGDSKITR